MGLWVNAQRRLRNGWWIAVFLLMLASLLVPFMLLAQAAGTVVSHRDQAILLASVSVFCQLLRRRPLAELVGALDRSWLFDLGRGLVAGAFLMLCPALFLAAIGQLSWRWQAHPEVSLASFAFAAGAEELMFRGFAFQRLVAGVGALPAQLIGAGFFLLTHLDNPGMQTGLWLARCNIFVASLVLGLLYLRTRRLALPLGLHFAVNVMQGPILGLGVSGVAQAGWLKAELGNGPAWLNGGAFGLEGSLPGLVFLGVVWLVAHRWLPKPSKLLQ